MTGFRAFASALMLMLLGNSALAADTWTCTYKEPRSGNDVAVRLVVDGNKLVAGRLGIPAYGLLENNQYSLIGVDHYSEHDGSKAPPRIFSSTVIIEKKSGAFLYTVAEIGEEPVARKGRCVKDL